jgi:hypothetical protein
MSRLSEGNGEADQEGLRWKAWSGIDMEERPLLRTCWTGGIRKGDKMKW